MPLKNWAGNLTYSASEVLTPTSVEELQTVVADRARVKALGSRHSFSDIADTNSTLISTEAFDSIGDVQDSTIVVGAGVRYGDLCVALRGTGLALSNLASLPHISIAGACATATHGSGVKNRNLSDAVVEMDFVLADGSFRSIKRGDADFDGAVVHLGALGIVTSVRLKLVPTFEIAQTVYDFLPYDELESNFQGVMGAGYSVSLFTTWSGPTIDQVWVKALASDAPMGDLFGTMPADAPRHPIRGMPADFCTTQLGIPGSWDERLAHFKMEFTPSSGEELQSEFFVPFDRALEALGEIRAMAEQIAPHLHISEVRSVAADDLWMSMANGRPSIGIHFTWKPHTAEVMALLPQIESRLAQYDARPHWAKLSTMSSSSQRYPEAGRFNELRNRLDPNRKFDNPYLAKAFR